jgi:HD-GYP domain-containing protein (c-di-GMP phosphodiesterase class II)
MRWFCISYSKKKRAKCRVSRETLRKKGDTLMPLAFLNSPAMTVVPGIHDVAQLYPFAQEMASADVKGLQILIDEMAMYDEDVYAHARRILPWADAVACQLDMPPSQRLLTCLGALLHDLGKCGIPVHILHKTGPLSEQEWAIMRCHTDIGYHMLCECGGIFALVAPIVRAHHERWDGTGYPLGLRQTAIPLPARIISVVDSYDAMISTRSYNHTRSAHEACLELQRCAGDRYDPHVVTAALPLLSAAASSSGLFVHYLSARTAQGGTPGQTGIPVSVSAEF